MTFPVITAAGFMVYKRRKGERSGKIICFTDFFSTLILVFELMLLSRQFYPPQFKTTNSKSCKALSHMATP